MAAEGMQLWGTNLSWGNTAQAELQLRLSGDQMGATCVGMLGTMPDYDRSSQFCQANHTLPASSDLRSNPQAKIQKGCSRSRSRGISAKRNAQIHVPTIQHLLCATLTKHFCLPHCRPGLPASACIWHAAELLHALQHHAPSPTPLPAAHLRVHGAKMQHRAGRTCHS